MNPWMLQAMADSRCRELRHDAPRRPDRAPRPASRPAPAAPRWPQMRRQVGYALVEAGLHLLATEGPTPRG
jgi:hypothetical protein